MPKKNFISERKQESINNIIGWKTPVFHQATECYVSLSAFDPSVNKFRIKKFMLGHIRGKRQQRVYGDALIKRLTEKLMNGWNPWVEMMHSEEYTSFDDAAEKYKEYLFKLMKEHNMREETVTSYISRLKILTDWKQKENISLIYTYQFDNRIIGKFLDYIFIDRNNTIRTRNNYLSWIKTFSKYLLERGYIPSDPTTGYSNVSRHNEMKNRDIIPDEVLTQIKGYLLKNNRHFLLACYILHYVFVRPREMSFLKVGDFSIKKQTLTLHGDNTKNHNDAVLTLPSQVVKLMIDLDIFSHPSQDYLFSDNFAPGRIRKSEKSFRDYWTKHMRKELGFSERYKFYSLKDTGITNMLRANTDILTVRDQARHSSILITDIYTPKDIKEANELLLNYHGIL
jgi:integrase